MEKKKRGGAGRGQGAKLKYGEPTTAKTFRVPNSFLPKLTQYVKQNLFDYIKKAKQ